MKKGFYSLKNKTKHIFTFNNKMVWSSLGIIVGSNNKDGDKRSEELGIYQKYLKKTVYK